jgi:hypothetical protein
MVLRFDGGGIRIVGVGTLHGDLDWVNGGREKGKDGSKARPEATGSS